MARKAVANPVNNAIRGQFSPEGPLLGPAQQPASKVLHRLRLDPADFCIFTDINDKQVAVNPQHVRCVQYNSVDSTRIEFDDTHHVTVKASVIDVTRGLRTSEN
jgi:hypothetical protein